MPSPTDTELDTLHHQVISAPDGRTEEALALIERFHSLLAAAALPTTHNYWNHYYYFKAKRLFEQRRYEEGLRLSIEGTECNPAYAGAWQYRGIFADELGVPLAAFHALKQAWRLGNDPNVLQRLVQILFRRKRYRAAGRVGRALLAAGRNAPSFRFLMAQVELQLHDADAALAHLDAFEGAAAVTDHSLSVRQAAVRLQAHRLRHVAIAGMPYIGSTLLGTLLGSLPNCAHAGETQELVHRQNASSFEFPLIDFEHDPPEAIPQCRICGAACPVFTRQFRAELLRDPVDWYFRIGRALGARTIISSDKFLSEYLRKDPLFRFDLLVLYKPLEEWVFSDRREEARKIANGRPTSPMAADLKWTLDYWANSYYGCLKDLRPQGRRLVVNWEEFARRPNEHFELIIRKLGLPGDASVFDDVRAPHYVGGNASIIAVVREGRVRFRPSRAGALEPEHQAIVDSHAAAQGVARMLDVCYRTDFRELF